MQWSNESYAGFSKEQPWMRVNPNYKKINVVNNLKNQDALWYHYQRLIDLRKNSTYMRFNYLW
jgi:glycosidase